MARLISIVFTLFAVVALAEDEAQRRAREEIERQLNQLVGSQPSRVRVEFRSVDDPNFAVEDFEVSVDGKPLKTPTGAAIAGWIQDGPMPVGAVDVTPGSHKVTAKLTIHNTASALATEEGDHRWKLGGDVAFDVRAGLEVGVVITATRDPKQTDLGKRIKLTFPSQPVMIAKLEDATMPETPKPKPVVIDAGPSKEELAAAQKTTAAEEKKLKAEAAAEEKKRKAEEALAAKQAAADEKKRKAEEALAAKQAAAEEKKRKAQEALAAKQAAAEEKKRKAEEAIAAKKAAADEKTRLAQEALAAKTAPPEAKPPEGAPVAQDPSPSEAVTDAGAVAVLTVVGAGGEPTPPVDAGTQLAMTKEEPTADRLPWPWIAGAGAALLAVVVFLARRSSRVPKLED